MSRTNLLGVVLTLVLTLPGEAEARINPLHVMTSGVRNPRAEIILVLDNSKTGDGPNDTGSGCSGVQPDLDVLGDGACTGDEPENSIDCGKKAKGEDPSFQKTCKKTDKGYLYMLKRAMRNVVPEFRTVATFGLATFPRHAGYYGYMSERTAAAAAKPEVVTVLLTEMELKYVPWIQDHLTDGASWDWNDNAPGETFTVRGVEYRRLDKAATTSDPGWYVNQGTTRVKGADSVYRRAAGDGYHDKRFPFQGLQFNDGTHNWEYVGSYFSFLQPETNNYATSAADFEVVKDEFQGPVLWEGGVRYVYHKFRYNDSVMVICPRSSTDKACVAPWDSMTAAIGHMWPDMYLEWRDDQAPHDRKMGRLLQWLNEPSAGGATTDDQSSDAPAHDGLIAAKKHFEDRINGTGPFDPAVGGPGPDNGAECRRRFVIFLSDGKFSPSSLPKPHLAVEEIYNLDPANPIQTFVVGMFTQSYDVLQDAGDMGDDGEINHSPGRMVRTGGDEASLTAALRETLLAALAGDFTTASPGVTTISQGSGVTIVDNVTLLPSTEWPGWKGHLRWVDLAVVDPDTGQPKLLWDAGQKLQGAPWQNRAIFSGLPSIDSGAPIRILDGTVKLGTAGDPGIKQIWAKVPRPCTTDADCPGTTCTGTACALPPDNDIVGLVQWIAGRDRPEDWKLAPIVASVPATVGPPPRYEGVTNAAAPAGKQDHSNFEATHENRVRISYVLSNEGLLHAFRTGNGEELFAYLVPDALWNVYELYRQGGQDPDPAKFKYVLATSVRIEDFPTATGYSTKLILTMGPGGSGLTVLDINEPVDSGFSLLSPPFKIEAHSLEGHASQPSAAPLLVAAELGWAHGSAIAAGPLSGQLGETWSIPSVFYDYASGTLEAHGAMGAGYWDGVSSSVMNNQAYLYLVDLQTAPHFKPIGLDMASSWLPCAPVSGQRETCHRGVVANAVAVIDESAGGRRQVLASYQADLAGRLVRFVEGRPDAATPAQQKDLLAPLYGATITGSQTNYPLHFPPAAYYDGTDVVLAINTHAFTEDVWDYDDTSSDAALKPDPPAASRVALLYDDLTAGIRQSVFCDVDNICGCTSAPYLPTTPCVGPASKFTMPTGQPLLVQNSTEANRMEAFFLYYEPRSVEDDPCGGMIGDTWIIRLVGDSAGTWGVAEVKKIEKTYGSGLTIVGRGKDLGVALTGIGQGAQARVSTHSGSPLGTGLGIGEVVSEGIREVN